MQSSHFAFLCAVLTAHSVFSQTFHEIKDACKKENNFDGDLEKLDYNDPAFPKAAKCTLACTLEKHDVFKADGSIDGEKEKEFVEKAAKNEEMKRKILKAIDVCDLTAKADKCETAYEFVKCKKNMRD